MNSDAPSLDSWVFEDIETGLRAYAEAHDAVYDKTHPVSCLPAGSTQYALRELGMTYGQVSDMAQTGYQTVAGWFNAKRNPSRSTVRLNIYPILCESYRRKASLTVRSDLDRKLVGHRVLLLLTTGSSDTPEEIQETLDQARERFHRSALTYAASKLRKNDLASIAHSALGFLALNHDELQTHEGFGWNVDRGQNAIYMRTIAGEEPNTVTALESAAYEMDHELWRSKLASMPTEMLQACVSQLQEELVAREAI